MSQKNLVFAMLLATLVAEHSVDSVDPFGSGLPPVVTQDMIKASRDKADLEMKMNTKRPWDGMDLTGPHAFEKRENAVEK